MRISGKRSLLAALLAFAFMIADVPALAEGTNEAADAPAQAVESMQEDEKETPVAESETPKPAANAQEEDGLQDQKLKQTDTQEDTSPKEDKKKPDSKPQQKPAEKPEEKPEEKKDEETKPEEKQPEEAGKQEDTKEDKKGEEAKTEDAEKTSSDEKKEAEKPSGAEANKKPDRKPGKKPSKKPGDKTPTPTPEPTAAPKAKSYILVVKTGNSGKLHLREKASSGSRSLGLYPNGTRVKVFSITAGWAKVRIDGIDGYMMAKYLSGKKKAGIPTEAPTERPQIDVSDGSWYVIATGNAGRLHLREYDTILSYSLGLYPNGTLVKGVNLNNGWVMVAVNGETGYMMRKYLVAWGGHAPVQPTPRPTGKYVSMMIATGNAGRLHLREGASQAARSLGLFPNGTILQGRSVGNGWTQVNIAGVTGYMMTRYLVRATEGTQPQVPVVIAPTAKPQTAVTYQQHGSYVNLRSTAYSADYSNVIAHIPSGTTVQVLQWGSVYTKVRWGSLTGYIITSYLR